MTIPSTGPLRHLPRELTVRRDRRPDWLLGVATALTVVVVVLSLIAVTSHDPVSNRTLSLLALLASLIVFAVIGALWLMRPRMLPTIEPDGGTLPIEATARGSVSPERNRGAWPFSSPPPPPPYEPGHPR